MNRKNKIFIQTDAKKKEFYIYNKKNKLLFKYSFVKKQKHLKQKSAKYPLYRYFSIICAHFKSHIKKQQPLPYQQALKDVFKKNILIQLQKFFRSQL